MTDTPSHALTVIQRTALNRKKKLEARIVPLQREIDQLNVILESVTEPKE